MKKQITAIYDSQLKEYIAWQIVDNEKELIRALAQQVNHNRDSYLYQDAGHYTAFKLGEIDTETGEIKTEYVELTKLITLKEKQENENK